MHTPSATTSAQILRAGGVSRPLARHRQRGGSAPLPAPPAPHRRARPDRQHHSLGTAVLLPRHARQAGGSAPPRLVPKAHRLPVVLSLEEVARFLEATSEPYTKLRSAWPMAPACALPRSRPLRWATSIPNACWCVLSRAFGSAFPSLQANATGLLRMVCRRSVRKCTALDRSYQYTC